MGMRREERAQRGLPPCRLSIGAARLTSARMAEHRDTGVGRPEVARSVRTSGPCHCRSLCR
jgi:hypothetical protein